MTQEQDIQINRVCSSGLNWTVWLVCWSCGLVVGIGGTVLDSPGSLEPELPNSSYL
ncbi:hypothetical protein INR49_010407 [Caranx melampygus]|nr:hypothetical protein INR49_010407 [Caranx melampygus]